MSSIDLDLSENEILAPANPVKYHDIEYSDNYVTVTQNRIRRRIPNGYYFEDTGSHIYISPYYSHLYQHKHKIRHFILNRFTKEWRNVPPVLIQHHIPERIEPKEIQADEQLTK